ncbi:hypothetical protein DPMN_171650 [Dreissena polymorpha]|uniref:Uncharacterized protein n=1 Tax=Dreissena polymorpha TaxID=45954 RepID=A0A9D4E0U0_DREPO|nr:hypothetical protein DPMN_171650 [Dreissena polymorpha]
MGLKFDPVPGGHKTEHMTFTRGDYCGRVAVTNNNNNILIMKLHRYIYHDLQMTPIDFQVTRSKVKVTVPKKRIHSMAATTTDSPWGACINHVVPGLILTGFKEPS